MVSWTLVKRFLVRLEAVMTVTVLELIDAPSSSEVEEKLIAEDVLERGGGGIWCW